MHLMQCSRQTWCTTYNAQHGACSGGTCGDRRTSCSSSARRPRPRAGTYSRGGRQQPGQYRGGGGTYDMFVQVCCVWPLALGLFCGQLGGWLCVGGWVLSCWV